MSATVKDSLQSLVTYVTTLKTRLDKLAAQVTKESGGSAYKGTVTAYDSGAGTCTFEPEDASEAWTKVPVLGTLPGAMPVKECWLLVDLQKTPRTGMVLSPTMTTGAIEAGTVTAVNGDTVNLTISGASYINVPYLTSYSPTEGDSVAVAVES